MNKAFFGSRDRLPAYRDLETRRVVVPDAGVVVCLQWDRERPGVDVAAPRLLAMGTAAGLLRVRATPLLPPDARSAGAAGRKRGRPRKEGPGDTAGEDADAE